MADKTQKEKIREFIRDIDNYVDYHGEADKEDIEPFIRKESLINFINEQFDLAIKETEERMVREIKQKIDKVTSYDHSKCPNKMTCIGYQNCLSDIENGVFTNHVRNK